MPKRTQPCPGGAAQPSPGPARPRGAQGWSREPSERRSQRGLVGRGGGVRGAGPGRRWAERGERKPGRRGPRLLRQQPASAAHGAALRARPRGSRSRFAPRLPPPSERCPGGAGGEAAAAEGRPERGEAGARREALRPSLPALSPPSPRARAEQRPFSLALHARAAATGGAALRSRLAAPALPGLAAALGPPGGPRSALRGPGTRRAGA